MSREREIKELERRYQEAVYSTREEITSPLQYEQMLTVISHFMQYLTENRALRKAVKHLTQEKHSVNKDKAVATQSDILIELLKTDSDKLLKIASRKKVPTEIAPTEGGRIPDDQQFALTLSAVKEFLANDDREIGEIPKQLGNLRMMVWALEKQGVSKRTLKPFSDPSYTQRQNDFAKKLKLNKLHKNYLRLDDYGTLEDVRKFIYQEMTDQYDQLVFLVAGNDDLIDFSHTKEYDQHERGSAKQRQIEYFGNLLRLHNYLIDELENLPLRMRVWNWLFANFGSSLASVVIILIVYYFALWLGAPIDLSKLTSWLSR